jgi:ubiquinone/menaquinone biosynthesis C-methylase UbiE
MAGSALLNAKRILEDVGVKRGMRVADFGAGGSGHLVFPAAERVGEDGRVFAVDIQRSALEMLEGRRRQYLVHNLDTVWGDFERAGGVAIDPGSLDVAFLVNTLWVLKDHLEAVKEIRRLMTPDGKIVVIDWLPATRHEVAPERRVRLQPNIADVYFLSGGCEACEDLRPSPAHWGRIYRLS